MARFGQLVNRMDFVPSWPHLVLLFRCELECYYSVTVIITTHLYSNTPVPLCWSTSSRVSDLENCSFRKTRYLFGAFIKSYLNIQGVREKVSNVQESITFLPNNFELYEFVVNFWWSLFNLAFGNPILNLSQCFHIWYRHTVLKQY